ncbi:MAG: hypothetical protein ACREQZ_00820 [Woeseiaceae bacterium]
MTADPLIVYVPGLKPKPEYGLHRRQLLRCLLAGIERIHPRCAEAIGDDSHSFDIVSWTYDFYAEHRDMALDQGAIDELLRQPEASAADRREAQSPRRRLLRSLYAAADYLPFLIPHFADENLEIQLRDLKRYVRNELDIADTVRHMLKIPLRAAAGSGRPLLLIGHSMGSVIAYDTLWQLGRRQREEVSVDLFLTMGSPLGQRYIQRRLLDGKAPDAERYPDNIRRWINVSAVGELTAIDPFLANDFAPMVARGLVESIEDLEVFNWFRLDGVLNVHAEYGYLVNAATARVVADWWNSHSP